MWCVCVWNYTLFASLDLTAFWRGGPMHWGRWHLQVQSCHGYYFCCVVWGKYRVCRAAFFCEAVDVRFWFWYVRKNVRRYVRKHVRKICQKECQKICQKECQKICQKECQKICQKECQKICQKECQKIYQKICQKECQKICQKERQKIASSQSAKLRVTEHISGDELYVYPHLTRSGWHKSDGCGSLSE